jgi:plastocyanin
MYSRVVAGGLVLSAGLLALVLVAGLPLAAAQDKGATPKEVTIKGHKYLVDGKEKDLEIKVGESVVWVNQDGEPHDATPDKKGDFEPTGTLKKKGDKSKPIKFSKAGTFPYHCSWHEEMHGKVIVK